MNLFVKTLFFIFTMFITVEQAKFSTVATISQERIAYLSRSSKAGGVAGQLSAQHIGGAVIGATRISSPVVQGAITGAVGGYAGGFTAGMLMTGDFGEANSAGVKGAIMGMSIGAASGAVSSYINATKNGVNPWNGNRLVRQDGLGAKTADLNLQKISDKYLKRNGIDAEVLNAEFVGSKVAHWDLYIDKNSRGIYILPKNGSGIRYFGNS